MADTVGEFLIKLGLDADNLDRQLNSVIDNVRGGLSNLMTGVVAPALAGLASGQMVQQFADEITQVDRLSESLGVSVENLSAWRTAAEMAGVEADEVGEIFADFNDWMVDAKFNEGGAMYTDFIEKGLLPAVTDANGEMKKTEDYILEFADALHKMDPAQASGIARQIGLSDLKTATWIQQGGDAIRQQLALAKEIGTYTKEDAAAAKEFTMSMTVLTHSLKMAALPIFRAIVPILTNIAKGFRELIKQVEPVINQFGQIINTVFMQVSNVVAQTLGILSKHLTALIPLFAGIASMKLAGVFLGIAGAIQRVVTVSRAFIFSPWGAVLTALLAIGVVIEEFIKWLNGGESALSGFFEKIFGSTDNAKAVLNDIYNGFIEVVNNFQDAFSELIPRFEELGQAVVNLFTAIVGSEGFALFVDALIAVIGFIVSAITTLIQFLMDNSSIITDIIGTVIDIIISIVDVVTSAVETINSAINSLIEIFTTMGNIIEQVGNTVQSIFNAMASAFNSFVGAVSSGASTIISWISEILNGLAELASNSLLGKVIGSIGGGVSALFAGGGGGNVDNSSTVYHQYNYGSSADYAAAAFPTDITAGIGAF